MTSEVITSNNGKTIGYLLGEIIEPARINPVKTTRALICYKSVHAIMSNY